MGILQRKDGPVGRELERRRPQIESRARAEAPKRTGELARSVWSEVAEGPLRLVLGASADHAIFVHEGTGLWGPRRAPIVAKPGKVFVFQGRDGKTVFTRRIRGQRPNRFLLRAVETASD